jgi:serine/threonine protein kinase
MPNQTHYPSSIISNQNKNNIYTKKDLTTLHIIKCLKKSKYEVFLTYSPKYSEKYAMKIFPYNNKEICKSYLNESRFSWLSHPNIISIIDVQPQRIDCTKGIYMHVSYLVMELAPFGDLADLVQSEECTCDEKLIRTYFHHLVSAIEYLHEHDISHLDIKPENLMIGQDYQLKMIDFDQSYAVGDKMINGGGTPNFRAPEIIMKKCRNPKAADIFSAGIILFALKTGILPYFEDSLINGHDLFAMLMNDEEKFWKVHEHLVNSSITLDQEFRELFIGMIAKDPAKRMTIEKIKTSEYYQGPRYSQEELAEIMAPICQLFF